MVTKPSVKSSPKPTYPAEARRKEWTGVVYLRVSISSSGKVTAVSVSRSSGHSILDNAAVSAMKRWKFRPAKNRAGEAVPSTVVAPIQFKLTD